MSRRPPDDPVEAAEYAERHLRVQREHAAQQGRRDAGRPLADRFKDGELQALYELAAAGL